MTPRRCYACKKPTLGCIVGGTCPGCGALDTAYGRFWSTKAEQPHYYSGEAQLLPEPAKALGQLNSLRVRIRAHVGSLDMDTACMEEAAAALAGKKVRMVVALEVIE